MKTNAKEYLGDVGFKRINEMFGLADAFCRAVDLDNLLSRKEKVSIKSKCGFTIQVVDRREQYEKRKKRAELAGIGF